MEKSSQIREFRRHIVAGDILAMAQSVTALHDNWGSLSENEQHEVLKLEAIFLSLVHARTEVTQWH
jgi:hypothetical protein